MHIAEKINKAYRMLWLIKRNFNEVGDEAFIVRCTCIFMLPGF